MIRQWQRDNGGWRLDVKRVSMRVTGPLESGRWTWALGLFDVHAHGVRTYKTAAGARAACERVARRLGVVL